MAHSLKRLPPPSISKSSSRRPPRLTRLVSAFLILFTLSFVFLYSQHRLVHSIAGFPDTPLPVLRQCRRLLRSYQRQLHLHPLVSRAITAGIIFFFADVLAQVLKSGGGRFSMARLMRYSVYGLLVMGPFLYVWYSIMNEYGPEDDLMGSLKKCLFEQITLEPICISMYIIYDGVICQRGWSATKKTLDNKFFALWFKNAVFWLPANFANYYIGTPDLRVVFANLCSLFWNIYFSTKVNRAGVAKFAQRAKYMTVLNHDREELVRSSNPASSTSVMMEAGRGPSDISRKKTTDVLSSARRSSAVLIV